MRNVWLLSLLRVLIELAIAAARQIEVLALVAQRAAADAGLFVGAIVRRGGVATDAADRGVVGAVSGLGWLVAGQGVADLVGAGHGGKRINEKATEIAVASGQHSYCFCSMGSNESNGKRRVLPRLGKTWSTIWTKRCQPYPFEIASL